MWKITLGIAAGLIGARLVGAWVWRAGTRAAVAALETPAAAQSYDEADWKELPAPVQRYFRRSVPRGGAMIRRVRHVQAGEFHLNGWKPMRATQWHATRGPGFVWDARIGLMPGLSVDVRDAYGGGEGAMLARVWGLWPVMNARGGAELAAGALQRYLGEAVWFPTALLPGQGVTWTAVDEHAARASLRDGAVVAELEFRFNDEGDVTGTYAPGRFRESKGAYVATPWESRCGAWAERHGMRIPIESEVAWWIEGRREPYWRGRVEEIEYW